MRRCGDRERRLPVLSSRVARICGQARARVIPEASRRYSITSQVKLISPPIAIYLNSSSNSIKAYKRKLSALSYSKTSGI